MPHKSVQQECLTRLSHKSVPEECPARVSHKSEECHARESHKSDAQSIQYSEILSTKVSRVSDKSVPQECSARVSRVSRASVPQECLTRAHEIVLQECVPQEFCTSVAHNKTRVSPTRVCHKSVPQECPTRASRQSLPQGHPTRDKSVSYKSVHQEHPTRAPSTRVSYKSVKQCLAACFRRFVFQCAVGFVGFTLFGPQKGCILTASPFLPMIALCFRDLDPRPTLSQFRSEGSLL